jgi:hypothetical protein
MATGGAGALTPPVSRPAMPEPVGEGASTVRSLPRDVLARGSLRPLQCGLPR